jgi:hypothetical protein
MPSTPSSQPETLEQAQQHIAAKRRRNWWLAVFIVALPLFWFVPGAIYMRQMTQAQNTSCQSTIQSLGRALLNYASDNDDHLPDAANWIMVAAQRTGEKPHCPADNDKTHPSSYAMNANLSGKKLSDIKDPHDTILLYETTSKASVPFGRGEDLVRLGKDTVGLGRHHTIGYRFNYYLMADGTVRAPKNLDEVKTYKWTP